jgi:hypothetical protein
MALSTAVAVAEVSWQLTFSYQPAGLVLKTAKVMPFTAKSVSHPGSGGAPLILAYRLQWLDAAGNELFNVPAEIPLGSRTVPQLGTGPVSHDSWVPDSGVFVLRVDGPPRREDVASVRLVYQGVAATSTLLGSAAAPEIPEAFSPSEIVLALPFVSPIVTADYAPGPLRVTKSRDTGPDENRLVLVVMGDGYTGAELDAGALSNQVSRFMDHLFSTSPWNACVGVVNVYQVDLVSNESGADYEDAPPGSGGTLRDTYLDARFWAGGTERALALSGEGISRAFAAADLMVGAGVWDEVLVFVNSGKYGGNGGAVSVSSVHPSADEIQVHELGHSVANLADEYETGLTSTNCVGGILRNMDCGAQFPYVKWDVWVEPGTPIPTPETAEYAGVVGAFEGGYYQARGIYRPMLDCKMRTLGVPFCPICKETHVLELFERIDLVGGATPAAATIEVTADRVQTFGVDPLPLPGISYRWFLDGSELTAETGPSMTITNPGGVPRNAVLQVTATHSTPLVRAQRLQRSREWNVVFTDLPTIAPADVAILEGDSGTSALSVKFTLSSPGAEVISASYATQDGSATAGLDYLPAAGQLVFQPGETTQTINLQVLRDTQPESDETFSVHLTDPLNAKLSVAEAVITIYDEDNPPSVAFARPTDGSMFHQGQPISILVNASKPHGEIARVDLFTDGLPWLGLTQSPYAETWLNAPPGRHSLVAVAWDTAGHSATSAPVHLTVLASSLTRYGLVSLPSAWRFDVTTNDYGSAWTAPGYDDIAWSGPSSSVFFSGNLPTVGPRNTPISLTYNGARIRSAYFRTHYQFPATPVGAVALIASNVVDDGAVFHLNGKEVGRLRMPGGTITRDSFALPGGWATNIDVLYLDSSSLVEGDNVLAVELHLASDTSFPATFGMSLDAVTDYVPVLERSVTSGVKRRVADFVIADLGGGRPTLLSAGPTSAAGGDVQLNGAWLYYLPPPGYRSPDSFSFAMSDAFGVNSGNVLVTIRADPPTAADLLVEPRGDGSVRLACNGIPGRAYAVESGDSPVAAIWQRLAIVVADEAGIVQHVHHPPVGSPPLSYRVTEP